MVDSWRPGLPERNIPSGKASIANIRILISLLIAGVSIGQHPERPLATQEGNLAQRYWPLPPPSFPASHPFAPTPVYRHHMAVVRALTAGGRKVDHDQPC